MYSTTIAHIAHCLRKMPLAVHMHTSMLYSLIRLTALSFLCPWVGWGLQCSPRPVWPLQAHPEFPPSPGRDVKGPDPRAAGVCPSPGSRAQRGTRKENQGPSASQPPKHLHRPCCTSPRPACCEPAAHGSSQGKPVNTHLYERQL